MKKLLKYGLLLTNLMVNNKSFGMDLLKAKPETYLKIINDTKDNFVLMDENKNILTGVKSNAKKEINISKYLKPYSALTVIGDSYETKLIVHNNTDSKEYPFTFNIIYNTQFQGKPYANIFSHLSGTSAASPIITQLKEDIALENILDIKIELTLKGNDLKDSILDFTAISK